MNASENRTTNTNKSGISIIGRKLSMTDNEILQMYKESKDKKKQIEIIADLTLCSKSEIIDILKSQGVDGRQLPRPRSAKPANTTKQENNSKTPSKKRTRKSDDTNAQDTSNISQDSVIGYINSLKERRRKAEQELKYIDEQLQNIAALCLGITQPSIEFREVSKLDETESKI